jgi:hypothetical protein
MKSQYLLTRVSIPARPRPRTKREFLRLALRNNYHCEGCQHVLHPDSEVDHIVPWSLCGDDSDENVQVLCPNCHAEKSNAENGMIRIFQRKLAELSHSEGMMWPSGKVVSLYWHTMSPPTPYISTATELFIRRRSSRLEVP